VLDKFYAMNRKMYHSPLTTRDKVLEIVTPEWQYYDNDDYNFDENRIVPVKEQRRMGTQRGNKTTPQAPAIEVRAKGLPPVPIACRCRLWNFGSALEKEAPRHDGTAQQLTMLRANVQIEVTENVAMFGPVQDDGFRYARLRCFITRGARVQCRKFHIAFYLDCLYLPPNMATPGPDESSFAVGNMVENFPWARSARMSISEKAMCPRLHDKTKKAKSKIPKNNGNTQDAPPPPPPPSDGSFPTTSPKRFKKSAEPPLSGHSGRMTNSIPSTPMNAGGINSLSKKSTSSPLVQKSKKELQVGGAVLPGVPTPNPLMMHAQMGGIPPPNGQGALYNSYLDRQMRMSRFSFPGLEDEMFQQAAVGDDGELASMESALGQGRRSSQFVGSQYWPYQQNAYYLNQPGSAVVSQQQQQQAAAAAAAAVAGVGANGMGGTGSPLPVANQSPTFGNTIQPSFSMDFTNGVELNQRRLSASGQWGADLQHRRISSADISRLSGSPLPANQPGRGPEWEALFDAHTKVLQLDKSSPDYLSKKTAAMTEVYRAAEMIEQRMQKR
jgi:hypothetical protein